MTISRNRRYPRSPFVLDPKGYMKLSGEHGNLPVSCWCERRVVAVSHADVLVGQTVSCGHPRCQPPDRAPKPDDPEGVSGP